MRLANDMLARCGRAALLLSLTGLALASAAQAAPGDLDPSFGTGGLQTTDFGRGPSTAASVIAQPDGKLVTAGDGALGLVLPRQNADGSLDTSFSGDGRQTFEGQGSFGLRPFGLARQADGRILVATTAVGPGGIDFGLLRVNADGSLDPTFSGDGRLTTDFGGDESGYAVAVQADGKIIAVGSGSTSGDAADFAVARYHQDGSLDTSFSGDGRQTTDFGEGRGRAAAVAVQPDGKLVVAGGTGSGFALARYNPDGSLDTGFSVDGLQTTSIPDNNWGADGLALQPDGRIVAVGGANGDFVLARYTADGSPDTSFSADGLQTTDLGGFVDEARDIALQADGKIVAAGQGGATGDFGLARYNPDGSLDPTFSGDGKQTTDFPGTGFEGGSIRQGANGVALQSDGGIVAAGTSGPSGDLALARYGNDGTPDASFGGDGIETIEFPGNESAEAVAVQADGRIVAVGRDGSGDAALARYNPAGSPDTSFSGDGRQTTDIAGASDVAIQPDGKIVVVGLNPDFRGGDFAVARYNPDGSLDTSFSGDGVQTADFGGSDRAQGVALQTDGKIVAAGSSFRFLTADFALVRFNADGSLDTSFSGDGKQTVDFAGESDNASDVAVQADGKIVAAGSSGFADFGLVRFNADGTLDPSFSDDGRLTTDLGGDSERAKAVAIQSDGKIAAAGAGGDGDFALVRYNPDGSLDTTFSSDGRQLTDFSGSFDEAADVTVQADGRIIAAGSSLTPGVNGTSFALARYNTDGSLDPSFSGDGQQTTDPDGGFNGATGVGLQAGWQGGGRRLRACR